MALTHAAILGRLQDIFADVMDLDDPGLTDQSTAKDYEEWDSLSNIRFVVAVERAFATKFSNAEIEALANVGDLVRLIHAKTA
jgi:acyl carrier protein